MGVTVPPNSVCWLAKQGKQLINVLCLFFNALHGIVKVEFTSDRLLDFIISRIADEGIACLDIKVDIRQWFNSFHVFKLCHHFEEEAELADLNCLVHDVYAVEVVNNDGFEDEIFAVWVLVNVVKKFAEVAVFTGLSRFGDRSYRGS